MNETRNKQIRYFSTFSGVGTDTFVFKRLKANVKCVGWSEIDKYAQQTHNLNHPELKNKLYPDITQINWFKTGGFDLLLGGFPCQSFSLAGKRLGFEDTRGTLFFELIKALQVHKPKAFMFENVKGILSHDKGNTHKRILDILSSLGYFVSFKVLNTKDFGIPQNRQRVWYVGFNSDQDRLNFRFPTYYGKMTELKHFLDRKVPEKYRLTPAGINRIKKTVENVHPTIISNYYKQGWDVGKIPMSIIDDGASERYQQLMRGLSPTLKATRSNYAIVPQFRKLTPREAFRLQGFKDDEIQFDVSDTQAYRQAGNGWSINVAELLLKEIIRII